VISHLLAKACKVARQAGVPLRAVQKANETDGCPDGLVEQLDDNATVLNALREGRAQVAAGTSWLWARTEMYQAVDILFIDEAGQSVLRMCLQYLRQPRAACFSVTLGSSINRSGAFIHLGQMDRPFAIYSAIEPRSSQSKVYF